LDDIDRKIISLLQLNGRTTFEELGEAIGFTSMGIKKRLQKLQNKNAIKVSALLNPSALKLFPAIMLLEMESTEAMQHLLDRFKDCPRVINIFKTIGGFNLIALVIAEDQDTLESISVEKCSLRSVEGIRRSEFYPISDVLFAPFLAVREHLARRKGIISACNVDCRPCARYEKQKCVGCPATSHYRGTL
jgi:DNA-binding Lrp family transcriptional regulator